MTTRGNLLEMMKDPDSVNIAIQVAGHMDEQLCRVSKDLLIALDGDLSKFSKFLKGDLLMFPWRKLGSTSANFIQSLDLGQYAKVIGWSLTFHTNGPDRLIALGRASVFH